MTTVVAATATVLTRFPFATTIPVTVIRVYTAPATCKIADRAFCHRAWVRPLGSTPVERRGAARYPWPVKKSAFEIEPSSPIPFHTGSNGEFAPPRKTPRDTRAERLFEQLASDRARRIGVSRRDFVTSILGTATALHVINHVYGCGGGSEASGASGPGGGYGVGGSMMMDPDEACTVLSGDEFIFDVQTHHVNPDGEWRDTNESLALFLTTLPQASCGDRDKIDCFTTEHYIREMFINSDTDVAVLSALPGPTAANGLTADEMRATKELINTLADSSRSITHAIVHPDEGQLELDGMQQLAEDYAIGAWKCYPPYGGWRLDDPDVGIPFIEKARELGVKNICIHKGLPLAALTAEYASPDDVGVVAAAYPDVNFIVYHSGFDLAVAEGPYDPDGQGIDRLIKTVLDNEIPTHTGNVYAELGSTWRFLMTSPTAAAHVLGKLMLYLGDERIVWGTDSIWYGSPQDQIDAFRAFEISDALYEEHGYPKLSCAAKRKIFGLNSASLYGVDPEAMVGAISGDELEQAKQAARHDPKLMVPSYRAVGPQTDSEWLRFCRWEYGRG